MSHRSLFFMSIAVIIIGLAGIILQKKEKENPPQTVIEKSPSRKTKIIAEATRELNAYDILTASDFRFREVEIDEGNNTSQEFTSLKSTDLSGYLVLYNISQGSTILSDMIESPLSPTFVKHSLKSNELPYAVKVSYYDAYLLNFLNVGNKVTLYLRMTESSGKGSEDLSELQGGGTSLSQVKNVNTIRRFLGPLDIIKVSSNAEKMSYQGSNPDDVAGEIILRINHEQMKKIRVVEKYAEILISHSSSEDDFDNSKLSLSEVLPQLTPFHTVRELRGTK